METFSQLVYEDDSGLVSPVLLDCFDCSVLRTAVLTLIIIIINNNDNNNNYYYYYYYNYYY